MTAEDAIYIEVEPDVVWAVTVDVERWPEWNPNVATVVRVDDGPIGLGSAARIKQPGQPTAEWTVSEFVPGKRFVWGTRRLGFRLNGSHELESDGAGTTNLLRVEATGAFAVILWPVLRLAVRWALVQENRGLKARCEELSGREPPVGEA
jgi:hypothetical protein